MQHSESQLNPSVDAHSRRKEKRAMERARRAKTNPKDLDRPSPKGICLMSFAILAASQDIIPETAGARRRREIPILTAPAPAAAPMAAPMAAPKSQQPCHLHKPWAKPPKKCDKGDKCEFMHGKEKPKKRGTPGITHITQNAPFGWSILVISLLGNILPTHQISENSGARAH